MHDDVRFHQNDIDHAYGGAPPNVHDDGDDADGNVHDYHVLIARKYKSEISI